MKKPSYDPEPDRPFPMVSKALVDRLEEIFPNQCPDPEMHDRLIWFYAGERRVVDMLKGILADQTADSLEPMHD